MVGHPGGRPLRERDPSALRFCLRMRSRRLNIPAPIRTVLVARPDPDDETLGCGGTVALLARSGCAVHIVFVTDGSYHIRHTRSTHQETLQLFVA